MIRSSRSSLKNISRHLKFRPGIVRLLVTVLFVGGCQEAVVNDSFVGYVEGEYVYIAAPQSGWIESMSVKEGDTVHPGDVLFELDNDLERLVIEEVEARASVADAQARNIETGARPEEIAELEARLAETEALFALADSEYERLLPLLEKKLVSRAEGDRAVAERNRAKARVAVATESIRVAKLSGRDAELDAARASVNTSIAAVGQAEWNLDQRSVMTRIDGRIETLFQRKGEYVRAGSPILSILPPNAVKIRFFMPQEFVSTLAPGDVVNVSIDGVPDPIEARVSFVAAEAEFTPPVIYSVDSRDKLVFMVEARIPESAGLRPGIPVDVRFP